MTVPDGFSHNTPKASEDTPCWWKVKALLLGRLNKGKKKPLCTDKRQTS